MTSQPQRYSMYTEPETEYQAANAQLEEKPDGDLYLCSDIDPILAGLRTEFASGVEIIERLKRVLAGTSENYRRAQEEMKSQAEALERCRRAFQDITENVVTASEACGIAQDCLATITKDQP